MKNVFILLVLVIGCSFVSIGNADASSASFHRKYMDELKISNFLEAHGVAGEAGHLNIDSAFCSGLRRYGVRTSYYGLDKFWHFDCELDDSHGHFWDLKLKTITNGRYWTWRATSFKSEF